MPKLLLDFLYNLANKEEFVGYTERSTAAYALVREDARVPDQRTNYP
nr:palindromic element RPE1 domain-containing protein [Rickettsia rhipicephali]